MHSVWVDSLLPRVYTSPKVAVIDIYNITRLVCELTVDNRTTQASFRQLLYYNNGKIAYTLSSYVVSMPCCLLVFICTK